MSEQQATSQTENALINEMDKEFNENEFLEKVKQAAEDGAKQGTKGSFGSDLVKVLLLKVMLPVLIIIAVMMLILPRMSLEDKIKGLIEVEAPVENHDMTLENTGILGYTVADFQDAILGDSSKLKELEVLSYKVADAVVITDTGLLNLKVFTKTQLITYHGTAVYSIDLSKINKDSIKMNEENKVITLAIPHATLKPINIQASDIEFGDTEKGLLAFGEVKLSPEDQANIQVEAQNKMEEKLVEEKIADEADRFGKMAVWEIYQPIITNVSPEYSLEIIFTD